MTDKFKVWKIFEKGHNNKNWEKIEKWIDDESICGAELKAILCARFGDLPQVRNNSIIEDSTKLMVAGDIYEITIRKVV